MGVMPLQYLTGQTADTLGLTGKETISIIGISNGLFPLKRLKVEAIKEDGAAVSFEVISRLDSAIEIEYYRHGGILNYVLRQFLKQD
jgi:aconitate hydratase